MLLQGSDELKKYLPSIVLKRTLPAFDDAILLTERDVTACFLGPALYGRLDGAAADDDKDLKECARRVIAIQAFLSVLPDMDLVLTEAGFGVTSSDSVAPASKQRVESLTASLEMRLTAAKNQLVDALLSLPAADDEVWRTCDVYNEVTDGLVWSLSDMERHHLATPVSVQYMPSGWGGFVSLRARLHYALYNVVMDKLGTSYIGELTTAVRQRSVTSPVQKEALRLVKCAVVSFALNDTVFGDKLLNNALNILLAASDEEVESFVSDNRTVITHADTPIY